MLKSKRGWHRRYYYVFDDTDDKILALSQVLNRSEPEILHAAIERVYAELMASNPLAAYWPTTPFHEWSDLEGPSEGIQDGNGLPDN